MDEEDQLSYDIFNYEMQIALDGFKYHFEYMPFNQMFALPLTIGQLGSGSGAQPFKTVKDYDDWLKRTFRLFSLADTAKANFSKGIKAGIVMPKALALKTIPQMQSMVVLIQLKVCFMSRLTISKSFSDADKSRLKEAYTKAIMQVVVPTYQKLGNYLKQEYLPHTRSSSGFSDLPNGEKIYAYLVKQQTTTDKKPEEIYQLGLSEVARIRRKWTALKTVLVLKVICRHFRVHEE